MYRTNVKEIIVFDSKIRRMLVLNQYFWKVLGLKKFFTNVDCLICTEPNFWHCSSLFC